MFPMLMTAAGTVKPARVVIMGVGVAGLQAIATAKRLGAVVEATDLRPTAKEQVESLGGKWLDVPMSSEEQARADEAAKNGYGGRRVSSTSRIRQPLSIKQCPMPISSLRLRYYRGEMHRV